jgi:mRNA interferase MazF
VVGVTEVRTGDVWLAHLDPIVGHEQGGRRPVVVISSDGLHSLPINMVVVVPLTGQDRGLVTQPPVTNETSGLRRVSFARPEDVRSVDGTRLERRLGTVSPSELAEIRKVLRYFLDL